MGASLDRLGAAHSLAAAAAAAPQVRATMGKFEERLWSIIRSFLQVSQDDPGLLVTALQVGGRERRRPIDRLTGCPRQLAARVWLPCSVSGALI